MKGLTIIEVVIALGAGTVILTALTLVTLTSLNNSRHGSSEALATQFAQEGMEVLRNMKDNNWSTFNGLSDSTTYCMASSCSVLNSTSGGACGPKVGSCGLNVASQYIREAIVVHDDPKCLPPLPVAGRIYMSAKSTISWGDSQCTSVSDPYCHSVNIESCFSNFENRTAP